MEIRYLSESDDRKEVSRIYEESWKYAYRGMIPQDYLDSIPKGKWVKNLGNPEWQTMLCIENDKCIGVSSFCKSRFKQYPNSGEIISIYFLPDYIGKGYGKKLIKAVLGELKKQGYKEVFLWTLEMNNNAIQFYEKICYITTGNGHDVGIVRLWWKV